jgi:hypothetical protein
MLLRIAVTRGALVTNPTDGTAMACWAARRAVAGVVAPASTPPMARRCAAPTSGAGPYWCLAGLAVAARAGCLAGVGVGCPGGVPCWGWGGLLGRGCLAGWRWVARAGVPCRLAVGCSGGGALLGLRCLSRAGCLAGLRWVARAGVRCWVAVGCSGGGAFVGLRLSELVVPGWACGAIRAAALIGTRVLRLWQIWSFSGTG